VQKFVTIRLGVSFLRMRDFANQKCLLDEFLRFLRFLQLAAAKAPGQILTQNTQKHAVPPKDMLFRGREHKIQFRPPFLRISAILGTIFDGTYKIFRLKSLNNGDAPWAHLLIVIVDASGGVKVEPDGARAPSVKRCAPAVEFWCVLDLRPIW